MATPSHYDLPQEDLRILLHEREPFFGTVPEAFVQDVWARTAFHARDLQTTDGAQVQIVSPGTLNEHAGPDFSEARVRLLREGQAPLLLVGDVEIHRTSKEWEEHGHQRDPRYNRVVLHVSLLGDKSTGSIKREDGTVVPELLLYPRLTAPFRTMLYQFHRTIERPFPCSSSWPEVPPDLRRELVRGLGAVRMRRRAAQHALRAPTGAEPIESLFAAVMRSLGHAPNGDAMESLAGRTTAANLRLLTHQTDREAFLFGASGLLPDEVLADELSDVDGDYVSELRQRYSRIAREIPHVQLRAASWRFGRLRPANFPTVRIAQAAALFRHQGLFAGDALRAAEDALYDEKPLRSIRALLQLEPHPFWLTHVRLDRKAERRPSAAIGEDRANLVIVNAVLPALMHRATASADRGTEHRLLDLHESLPATSDSVTRPFVSGNFRPASALESQGLHELFRFRCTAGRCLQCPVGRKILGVE
ncbi:DUF2851 family protein [soil metagenome]